MRKAQNPGGNRGGIGKRAMRRTEEQEIETGQCDQFGAKQNRDLAPQQRSANAHPAFFFAPLRSIKGTTANPPAKAVNARIAIPQASDKKPLLSLERFGLGHGADSRNSTDVDLVD
jgi:hypothetical protein